MPVKPHAARQPSTLAPPPGPVTESIPQLLCPGCGYDLRFLSSDRCPECGLAIDRTASAQSRLPWSHRQQLGPVRAFWRTVRLAVARPDRVGAEVSRPVSADDARRFRRLTVLIAFVPLAAFACSAYLASLGAGLDPAPLEFLALPGRPMFSGPAHVAFGWVLEFLAAASCVLALWLFLMAATGVSGYFFHPARLGVVQQNRAVALSQYGCAALAFTPVTVALAAAAVIVQAVTPAASPLADRIRSALSNAAVTMMLAQGVSCYLSTLFLLRFTTHCGTARLLTAAVALPACWGLLGALILAGIPLAVGFVALVILSFV